MEKSAPRRDIYGGYDAGRVARRYRVRISIAGTGRAITEGGLELMRWHSAAPAKTL
ncbi:hypothetical protein [Sorlinia euscelidii]|uniref:hypothetical protein n=1 Tax=Sorlinia euscelidii TaxID=3081148 RepID=UPI00374E0584